MHTHRYSVQYLGHKQKPLAVAHEGEFLTAMSKAEHLGKCQVSDRVTGLVWTKELGWHEPAGDTDPMRVKLADLTGFDFSGFKELVRDIATGHFTGEGEL